jgi:hypothetical protein
VATKTDCRNAVINAYGAIQRDELEGANRYLADAYNWLSRHLNGAKPFDSEPHQIVRRLRDWWIVRQLNPLRWFKRTERKPGDIEKPKGRATLKKTIAVVVFSVAAGIGSNYFTSDFGGPTALERGQFTQIQQCNGCETIRTEGKVCAQCGTSAATEKIAAPLRAYHLGGFWQTDAGWQFKDGSTQLIKSGEYIVPELVVLKTMRM